jgi:hypothetical protein
LHTTCPRTQVSYKEPTPPDTELVVRSHVVAVRENTNPGLGKAAVEVDIAILLPQPDGSEKLLVQVGVGLWGARQPGCARSKQHGRVQHACCSARMLLSAAQCLPRAGCGAAAQGTGIFKRLGALRAL